MSFRPNPSQVLYLWSLLAAGGEGFAKDMPFQPEAKQRKALVGAGFLEEEKRTRGAIYNTVTDTGWSWVAANMDADLPTRSTRGVQVLKRLLGRIGAFLSARELSLAELLALQPERDGEGGRRAEPDDLESRIRDVHRRYAGRSWGSSDYVRLADLRRELPDVPREVLDQALFRLEEEGSIALYPLENPRDIGAEDRAASLVIGSVGRRDLFRVKE